MLPAAWVNEPLTVIVPIELPGASVPRAFTVPKIVPVPPKVPAAPTVTLLVTLPFTASVPVMTLVGPV
jgi:hypothetical protein